MSIISASNTQIQADLASEVSARGAAVAAEATARAAAVAARIPTYGEIRGQIRYHAFGALGSWAIGGTTVQKTNGVVYSAASAGLPSGSWKCMGIASVTSSTYGGTSYNYLYLRAA